MGASISAGGAVGSGCLTQGWNGQLVLQGAVGVVGGGGYIGSGGGGGGGGVGVGLGGSLTIEGCYTFCPY
jgi:hypothetical protein